MNKFLALGEQPVLQIIYQDQWLLAVNKPAGQLFHGYTKGLPSPLVDQIKSEIQPYVGVVHRLDRPVSGVALFARNSKIAGRLGEQFQQRSLDKIYVALVEGEPTDDAAVLEDMLDAPPSLDRPAKGPQHCHLHYQKLKVHDGVSLLAIKLGTGRRHQIRMQLSRRGWPILGDREYGATRMLPGTELLDARFCPLALHAARLRLLHPQLYSLDEPTARQRQQHTLDEPTARQRQQHTLDEPTARQRQHKELLIEAPLPWYWLPELFLETASIPDGPT